MKKFLSFVLSALMLLSCTSFVLADNTAEEKNVTYSIGEITTVDEKIAVPIKLDFSDSYEGNVGTGKIVLTYDGEKLAYDNFTTSITGHKTVNGNIAGEVCLNFAPSEPFNASTELFVLYFTQVAGKFGDVDIKFNTENMNAANAEASKLTFATIDGKVTLPKPKYTVTFATTVGTAPEAVENVEHGTEIDLPTLSDDELTFGGWRVGDTDKVIAVGEKYEVTSAVILNAVWTSTKVYLSSESGNDNNDGQKSSSPVKTLAKAMELMTGDKDTIVIVDKYIVAKDNNKGGVTESLGIAGKNITITGKTQEAIFSLDREVKPGTTEKWNYDDASVNLIGNVTFKNITVCGNDNDGKLQTNGFKFEYDNVSKGTYALTVLVGKNNSNINLTSGAFKRVHLGASGTTYNGNSSVVIDGENVTADFVNMAHGWHSNNVFNGIFSVTLNKGNVTSAISVDTEGAYSSNSYSGLRYITLNGGTVKNIVITSGPVYQTNGATTWNPVKGSGVTVVEVNAKDVITGKITAGRDKQNSTGENTVFDGSNDCSEKVIIYNNGSYAENQIDASLTDDVKVFKVKNGTLTAKTTEFDNKVETSIQNWATNVKLLGLAYVLPENSDFNAVKVGDDIYYLSELKDNLIPVPEDAGTYDVEFGKAATVKFVNGEKLQEYTKFVGETITLERLEPQNNLKHAGWTATKDGTTAEIAHTGEYEVTKNETLYAVWSDVTSYTITFIAGHGTNPEPITVLDEDEDGNGDEKVTLPDLGKVGHFTFKSWNLGSGNGNLAAGVEYTLTKNITATAEWDEDPKATITYVDEIFGAVPEAYTGYVGDEFTVCDPADLEVEIPEGYLFGGWKVSDELVYNPDSNVRISTNLTLTAVWKAPFAFEVDGAKGEAPQNLNYTIGSTISAAQLPDSGTLKKANCRFAGWATTEGGEPVTEYTVKKENNVLYAIWEEVVENAGIIETNVTYYSGSGKYIADVYFRGYNANTVALGYAYGENLTFEKFTPANGLDFVANELTVNDKENRYYATCIAKQEDDGIIKGADGKVLLGTFEFVRDTSKGEYSEDNESDNIQITTPHTTENNAYSDEYFLYVPYVASLEVEAQPVVFDEVFDYEIINVEYTVNGSVKVIRADGTAPANYAVIKVQNSAGNVIKEVAIENAETTTQNGVFEFSVNIPEGEYTAYIYKTGYARAKVEIKIEAQDGADQEGFVPQPITLEPITLIAGDVVEDENVINLLDFVAITSRFNADDISEEILKALDIDENGGITVDDLYWIKKNFGYSEN